MATVLMTDKEIEEHVNIQMQWDSRVAHEGIIVTVEDNEATLSGTVPTYSDRLYAEENAKLVYGVTDVDNRLIVSLPGGTRLPTDAELRTNIESIIKWSSHLQDEKIDVSVQDRHVLLSGTVDAYWKKLRATELTAAIQGVTEITNEITTVPTEHPADEETAQDIMDALSRNAHIDVDNINLTVRDGHVTLSGNVNSMSEYRMINDIARYTFGVVNVINLLTVKFE
ncbi:MAG: BON domain-containing protein [Anaerolineae bacterium]